MINSPQPMNAGFSRQSITVLLVFVCLAVVVDWFLVPHLQARGMALLTAILFGAAIVATAACFSLIVGWRVVKWFRRSSVTGTTDER